MVAALEKPRPPCIGDNTVAALISGALDAAGARALEHHLDACASCRRLVADLGRGLRTIDRERLPVEGERVGRYTIRRAIGAGGMGVVYEAFDAVLERRVAIKLVRPERGEPHALLAEARAMARLSHRNICAIHDAGSSGGRVFLCMEYVAGATLREWLDEAPRSVRDIAGAFAAAARGLAYIHGEGVVHLDFKPDNVLVDRSGRVVVTDFGLAALAASGAIAGTPRYMAPEQRLGRRADARADQYAFCVALGEALEERAPAWVRRVIARGTAERPEARFAAMAEIVAALERGLDRARRRAAVIVAATAAVAVAFAVARTPQIETRTIDRTRTERVTDHVIERVAEPGAAAQIATRDDRATRAHADAAVAELRRQLARVLAAHERSDTISERAAVLASDRDDRDADDPRRCDVGERTCSVEPPWCPDGSLLAIRDGCWTCADEHGCAPLGLPRDCADGSPLRCTREPPVCPGHLLPSIRGGCWECADPFACAARSPARPLLPGLPDRCGNGICDPGESHANCARDCNAPPPTGSNGSANGSGGSAMGSGSGSGTARCGNGFCELGEDHASCAQDCCETTGSGGCAAVCGNGFCEAGEDHASCAQDCCATDGSGACR